MFLGDFRIEIIPDTEFRLDGGAMFGVVPRILWEKVCAPDELNRIQMQTNCLFVETPNERILIETGMGEKWMKKQSKIYGVNRIQPLAETLFERTNYRPEDITIVVNTHLHFDHCGGNHLFAGKPFYVQRQELDDARSEDDYTIREWVAAPGVQYVPVDGELDLLPGLRLLPAPGHTRGSQVVVVETGGRPVVIGGDVAVSFGELDEPRTEGQRLVRALDPELVWLAHEHEPWRSSAQPGRARPGSSSW